MPLFVAAIADDDTGATDLAGMLTAHGMRVVLLSETPSAQQLDSWAAHADAVIIGTAARSIPKAEAYARTFAAAQLLQRLQPRVLAIKYCSTFDSTAEGNIGASIDAALDATGETFTIALPALPALGRTTYMGYHFVGPRLLSDSVMRHHPLNPMTNPHLPSHLQSQTARAVGLLHYTSDSDLRPALDGLRQQGTAIAILDCLDQPHLERIGEAIADLPVLTGSSAWAMVLPPIWRRSGAWAPSATDTTPLRAPGGSGFLIVSGSCSEATRSQNAWAAQRGFRTFSLDPQAIISSPGATTASQTLAEEIASTLATGQTCLLSTTEDAGLAEIHALAAQQNLSPIAAGERIAEALASTVAAIFDRQSPQGLIIAGGETSSTLVRALHLGGLRIGPNIEPGVPVCVALARPSLAVVLKSGNFGSPDFYGRAITAISALPSSSKENS